MGGGTILAAQGRVGIPKTKRIKKMVKSSKKRPTLNIDFEEDDDELETSEKLKEFETN